MGYIEITTKDGEKVADTRLWNPPVEARGARTWEQYRPISDKQIRLIAHLLNCSNIHFNDRRAWVQEVMGIPTQLWSIEHFSSWAGSYLIDKLKELNADVR